MAAGGLRPAARRAEWAARWLVAGVALGLPLAALGARVLAQQGPAVEVHARVAEAGGWMPGNLTVAAGEPLRLRLVSDDVVHGFALGQSSVPPLELAPGQVVEADLTFDRPGTYVYYCTRWCGLGHWRMRGTITVTGTEATAEAEAEPPLYMQLGLDVDTPHPAARVPPIRPDAARGAAWADRVPASYLTRAVYEAVSPAALWQALRSEAALNDLSDTAVWDVVAWLWSAQTNQDRLAEGRDLFAANCAACHGEQGRGDGVFADDLSALPYGMAGHAAQGPADFTDASQMLGASSAILQGKIIRGGMGTSMPYWGPVFTDRQVWALVDFLWSFQFSNSEVKP
jgi:cytochrome c oxidase subunit 2